MHPFGGTPMVPMLSAPATANNNNINNINNSTNPTNHTAASPASNMAVPPQSQQPFASGAPQPAGAQHAPSASNSLAVTNGNAADANVTGSPSATFSSPHPNPAASANGTAGSGGGGVVAASPSGATPIASTSSTNPASSSSASSSSSSSANGLVYPALHLHPLNDTFAPKQISLAPPGPLNRIKIGRQTNAKTVPHPSNGYFDSKVLSRMHAEVWSQDGKVFIKDVKSSNGTFINGERLSPEAQESDVFELHNEDMVEFGIDIVGDDNKTIIHHKVACRVYLVLTAEDALGIRNDFASLYRGGVHGGPIGGVGSAGSGIGPGSEGGLRRGKSNMSFDHILGRLQSELQKSKETGSELGSLGSAMSEIHDTLSGGLPPMAQPPYQHMVPPAHPETKSGAPRAHDSGGADSVAVTALQDQLSQTQSSLLSHVDKIKSLEGMLAEHEVLKAEVGLMKAQMEEARRELEDMQARTQLPRGGGGGGGGGGAPTLSMIRAATAGHGHGANGTFGSDDFDDGASMASVDTVTPDAPGMADVPRGAREARDEDGQSRGDEGQPPKQGEDDGHVGPRAPPDLPPELAARDATAAAAAGATLAAAGAASGAVDHKSMSPSVHDASSVPALSARLESLEAQLQHALSLGRNLEAQHAEAVDTVRSLTLRVQGLEASLEERVKREVEGNVLQALEGRFSDFRRDIEERWQAEKRQRDATRAADGVDAAESGGDAAASASGQSESAPTRKTTAAATEEKVGTTLDAAETAELRKVVRAWDQLNERLERELWEARDDDDDAEGIDGGATSLHDVGGAASRDASAAAQAGGASALKAETHAGEGSGTAVAAAGAAASKARRRRGAAKRHLANAALRKLLYAEEFERDVRAALGDAHAADADAADVGGTSSTKTRLPSSSSLGSRDAGGGASAGAAARGTAASSSPQPRSFAQGLAGAAVGLVGGGGGGTDGRGAPDSADTRGGGGAPPRFGPLENSHALPLLAGVGALTVGYAAWLLSAKATGAAAR